MPSTSTNSKLYAVSLAFFLYLFLDLSFLPITVTDLENNCDVEGVFTNLTLFTCSEKFIDLITQANDTELYVYIVIGVLSLLLISFVGAVVSIYTKIDFWFEVQESFYGPDEETQLPRISTLSPGLKTLQSPRPRKRMSSGLAGIGGLFRGRLSSKPPPGLGFSQTNLGEKMGYDTMKRIRDSNRRDQLNDPPPPGLDYGTDELGFEKRNFGARGGTTFKFTDDINNLNIDRRI
eukprot:snap_masked-scaffold_11-processed-gene-2.9-mRNA-1 protein AED:1.00 eAED:1.00 QI:0/0/0/0/1/1/2/0/233